MNAPTVVEVAPDVRATVWLAEGPTGSVVACHGGVDGLDDLVRDRAADLANRGWTVAAPHYRGEAGEPGTRRIGRSDVDDAVATAGWLASLGHFIDALWGNSRGGLVAILAAARLRPPVLALTAPIDALGFLQEVMAGRDHPVGAEIAGNLGGDPRSAPLAYLPYDGAAADLAGCRVAVAHASDDPVVPVARTERLVARLQASGVVVDARFPAEGGHRVAADPGIWEWLAGRLAPEAASLPAGGRAAWAARSAE